MALFEDASTNPETPLIDLDPFIESDLFLIISIYEKSLRESETEEGVIVSNYGEISKNTGNVEMFEGITAQYSEASTEKSSDGSIEVLLGKKSPNWAPFAECLPCDWRLSFTIDNLPHPAMFNIFKTFLDALENFLQMMKDLLDPTNFYADICQLLNALRIVCPQDLIVLLALLNWLLSYYIMLSFNIDLDWTSILALILLPILLLIHTLLQLAINIGLGPISCLLQLLGTVKSIIQQGKLLGMQAKSSVETSMASVADLGQELHSLTGSSDTSSAENTDANPSISTDEPVPDETADVGTDPKGGFLFYQNVMSKLNAFDTLLVSIKDIQITLKEILKRFQDAIQTLMELLNAGLILRMQFMTAIVQLLRLIGFIRALIKALKDDSVCKDPSQPLSTSDIQAIIATINGSSLSGTTNPNQATIGLTALTLDIATGQLTIESKLQDKKVVVPTCLSSISDDDRAKIQEWITQLDAST